MSYNIVRAVDVHEANPLAKYLEWSINDEWDEEHRKHSFETILSEESTLLWNHLLKNVVDAFGKSTS